MFVRSDKITVSLKIEPDSIFDEFLAHTNPVYEIQVYEMYLVSLKFYFLPTQWVVPILLKKFYHFGKLKSLKQNMSKMILKILLFKKS